MVADWLDFRYGVNVKFSFLVSGRDLQLRTGGPNSVLSNGVVRKWGVHSGRP